MLHIHIHIKCAARCTTVFFHSSGKYFPEVEDLENWHGKPLGKKAGLALEEMKKLITQPGPHGIKPLPIVDDAPKVTLPTVKLSSPPNYTMGDKVRKRES